MLPPVHSHTHKLQELSLNLEFHFSQLSWQELLPSTPHTLSLFIILSVTCAYASCILFSSITMRVSKSLARPTPGPRTGGSPHNKPQRARSSFDNLVIAHRTRIPSSRVSQIEPIDLEIARSLLDAAAQGPDIAASSALDPSDPRELYDNSSTTESDPQRTRSRSSGEFYIRQHSRSASWAVGEPCTEGQGRSSGSSSMDWRHHELGMSHDGPNDFADAGPSENPYTQLSTRVGNVNVIRGDPAQAARAYNSWAKAHGLKEFYVMQDFGQCPSLSPFYLVSDCFQVSHIVRKPVKEGGSKMSRSISLPQLRASPPKPPRRPPTSLYEVCLVGGLNTLKLPAEFSLSEDLLIPCSLAALGSYIVQEGEFPIESILARGCILIISRALDSWDFSRGRIQYRHSRAC